MFTWIYKNKDIDPTINFGRLRRKKVGEISKQDKYWLAYKSTHANKLVKEACIRDLNKR